MMVKFFLMAMTEDCLDIEESESNSQKRNQNRDQSYKQSKKTKQNNSDTKRTRRIMLDMSRVMKIV